VELGTETVLCLFCARERPTGAVAPLNVEGVGFVPGAAAPLDPVDAVALLARLGGSIEWPEEG
jgi:hypothetical protein